MHFSGNLQFAQGSGRGGPIGGVYELELWLVTITVKNYKMKCLSSSTKWIILNKPKQNGRLGFYSSAMTMEISDFIV